MSQPFIPTSAVTAAPKIESRVFHDIDEQAARLSGYDQIYQQIGSGRFVGRFTTHQVDNGVGLYVEEVNQTLYQRGRAPAGSHAIGFTMRQPSPGTVNGSPFDDGTLIVMPADSVFDASLVASTCFCVIDIPKPLLASALSDWDDATDPSYLGPESFLLRPGCDRLNDLRGLVDASIDTASQAPRSQSQVHAGMALQQGLIQRSLGFLARPQKRPAQRLNAAQRYKVFCRARDYLEHHVQDPISIPELCRAAAASRRTLEYCFSQVLGESPAAYLRALRLNGVRRDILAGKTDAEPIGDIAARWGLWHPSRFAASYKMMFGELPSQTCSHRYDGNTRRCGSAASAKT